MERRSFLKQSAALGAGLMTIPSLQSFAAADGPIQIGIIGCGDRGQGLYSVLAQMPDKFRLTAVCDVLPIRLDQINKRAGDQKATNYKDYEKLLADKSVDAVIISVPLNMHFPIAEAALEAGKHVYLEKTMTYNAEQALSLLAKKEQYPKQILQVGHQYRYTPLYFRVKEMIEQGYLGEVTQIDCRWDRNWNWRRPVPAGYTDRQINWRMYKEYSGGLPAELLSHQIDFINWAFNVHPDRIVADGGIDVYKDGRETYDNVQAILRYEDAGMIGNFGATCSNARDGYLFKLKGKKGTISLLMDEGLYFPEPEAKKEWETVDGVTGATRIEWTKDGGMPILKEKTKDGSWYALQEFYKVVSNGGEPVSNVHTGALTACCVDLINQASFSHAVEEWRPNYPQLKK